MSFKEIIKIASIEDSDTLLKAIKESEPNDLEDVYLSQTLLQWIANNASLSKSADDRGLVYRSEDDMVEIVKELLKKDYFFITNEVDCLEQKGYYKAANLIDL